MTKVVCGLIALLISTLSLAEAALPNVSCPDLGFQSQLERAMDVRDSEDAIIKYYHSSKRLGFGPPANDQFGVRELQQKFSEANLGKVKAWLAGLVCTAVSSDAKYGEEVSHNLKQLFPQFSNLSYLELYENWVNERKKGDQSAEAFQKYRTLYRPNLYKYQIARVTLPALFDDKFAFADMISHFWLNHFSVDHSKYHVVAHAGDYYETIRKLRNAKFSTLLEAVTKHPAMAVYLDNYTNHPPHFNLNHPREILELHSLGVRPSAGIYSQTDIANLARLMSYSEISKNSKTNKVEGVLRPLQEKTQLLILGQKYTTGESELNRLLQNLSLHPVTAQSLCSKLSRRLLGYFAVQESTVKACIAAWKRSDGTLLDVYQAIISQPSFWSREIIAQDYMNPLDATLTAWRHQHKGPLTDDEFFDLYEGLRRSGYLPFSSALPTGFDDNPLTWISAQSFLLPSRLGVRSKDVVGSTAFGGASLPVSILNQLSLNSTNFFRR